MLRNLLNRLITRRRLAPNRRIRTSPLRNKLRLEFLEDRRLLAAEVWTDKLDYAPGETAWISGSGFAAGSTITLQVAHTDGDNGGSGHLPWTIVDGGDDDLDGIADGNFQTSWYVNTDDSAGAAFLATATDPSGASAAWTFADNNPDAFFGAIFTSLGDGTSVNQNLYEAKQDVYLNGGPQNDHGGNLPDGIYYFEVTDPSGNMLLSSDAAINRQLVVSGGVVAGAYTDGGTIVGAHANGTYNPANGSTPVQLLPFDDTPNPGGEYKVHLIRQTDTTSVADDGIHINYHPSDDKTDNFKLKESHENEQTIVEEEVVSPIVVGGLKFEDHDGDGNQDLGDQGLGGWIIDVDGIASATTANDGTYSISFSSVGTYAIQEDQGAQLVGWTQTLGNAGYGVTVTVNNYDTSVTVGNITTITHHHDYSLTAGNAAGNDFGNFQNFDLCGDKYADINGNGFGAHNNLTPLANFTLVLYVESNGTPGLQTGSGGDTQVANHGSGVTDVGGEYCFTNLGPGTYYVVDALPDSSWIQTGGGDLNHNYYTIVGSSGVDYASAGTPGAAGNLDFSNVHLGQNTGLTIGFWSNKNGQALITSADLSYLRDLHLRNANGTDFNPTTAKQVGDFLTSANATNMANMLSAQLIATVLNVRKGKVTSSTVYVGPGNQMQERNTLGNNLAPSLNSGPNPNLAYGLGFVNINDLIAAADAELASYGVCTSSVNASHRPYQEAIKDVLDAINNNKPMFVL